MVNNSAIFIYNICCLFDSIIYVLSNFGITVDIKIDGACSKK